jgi:hypothetical protein
MSQESSTQVPAWIIGIVLAIALIFISTNGRFTPGNPALSQYFAAQPTPQVLPEGLELPQLSIGNLPPELQEVAAQGRELLGLGQAAPPVMSSITTPRLKVEISELRQAPEGLKVIGLVTNISDAELEVPISAFELRDTGGASYIAGGGAVARLSPGKSTPLDLTVPLPDGRGLLLIVNLPPDAPAEQVLLAEGT